MTINAEPVVELLDEDPTIPERNILSEADSYFLASCGFLEMNGHRYFKKKRYNTRLEAEKSLDKKDTSEIIVETRIAAFILTLKKPVSEKNQIQNQF
jgi:hypothetical protein